MNTLNKASKGNCYPKNTIKGFKLLWYLEMEGTFINNLASANFDLSTH